MMGKKKTKLQIAQEQAETALSLTNKKIEELGSHTGDLYAALNSIQESFDRIRNVPSEKKIEYEKLKSIRLQWKQQVDKIIYKINQMFIVVYYCQLLEAINIIVDDLTLSLHKNKLAFFALIDNASLSLSIKRYRKSTNAYNV